MSEDTLHSQETERKSVLWPRARRERKKGVIIERVSARISVIPNPSERRPAGNKKGGDVNRQTENVGNDTLRKQGACVLCFFSNLVQDAAEMEGKEAVKWKTDLGNGGTWR